MLLEHRENVINHSELGKGDHGRDEAGLDIEETLIHSFNAYLLP